MDSHWRHLYQYLVLIAASKADASSLMHLHQLSQLVHSSWFLASALTPLCNDLSQHWNPTYWSNSSFSMVFCFYNQVYGISHHDQSASPYVWWLLQDWWVLLHRMQRLLLLPLLILPLCSVSVLHIKLFVFVLVALLLLLLANPDFVFKLLLFGWFWSPRRSLFLRCLWSFWHFWWLASAVSRWSVWLILFFSILQPACYLPLKWKYLVINLIKLFIFLKPGFIFQKCIIVLMNTQIHL